MYIREGKYASLVYPALCPSSKRKCTYCPNNRIDFLSYFFKNSFSQKKCMNDNNFDNIFEWIIPPTKWCDMDLTEGFFRSSAGLQHSSHGLSQQDPLMRVRRERTDQHLSIHLRMDKRLKFVITVFFPPLNYLTFINNSLWFYVVKKKMSS